MNTNVIWFLFSKSKISRSKKAPSRDDANEPINKGTPIQFIQMSLNFVSSSEFRLC